LVGPAGLLLVGPAGVLPVGPTGVLLDRMVGVPPDGQEVALEEGQGGVRVEPDANVGEGDVFSAHGFSSSVSVDEGVYIASSSLRSLGSRKFSRSVSPSSSRIPDSISNLGLK